MLHIPLHIRKTVRPILIAGATAALLGSTAITANAAVTLTASDLKATVSGTSVSASVKITAGSTTTVDVVKICARDANGKNVDFASSTNAQISSNGTLISRSGTFAIGTYTYWGCAKVGGVWWNLGQRGTFSVGSTTSGAGGSAMPVGDLPGWKQVFADDFTTSLARGSFPGPYAGKWLSYDGFTDTSKAGDYDQDIISAQGGTLDLFLHAVNGRPKGAAPVPLVNGKWGGQVYGRFSVRMKSDPLLGYGAGFLLWPDSGNWNDGEVDFPESGLQDVAKGFSHCPDNGSKNCLVVNTTARYSDWHTYTISWTPAKLSFLVDGKEVGSTTNVPHQPLHWVMQAATASDSSAATSSSGHLLIDWATIYTYQG